MFKTRASALVSLSASISTMSSDWHLGLPGDRSLYSPNAQCAGMVLVLSETAGREPLSVRLPSRPEKTCPKIFISLCKIPGVAGDCAGYAVCLPTKPCVAAGCQHPSAPWILLCVSHFALAAQFWGHTLNSCSSAWDMCTLVLQLTVGESPLSHSSSLVLQTFTLWEPQYPGLGWYRINFLPRSWYTPMFSI